MRIFLVGGAVRDRLLGRPVADRDWVAVGATAEDLLAQGFRRVGADFPVFLHPETREEYALARAERKRGIGHKGFDFDASPTVTLEQDLARRDLTINAMAETPDGEIVDPYGGQEDLARGILRHVTGAFAEDPLRVLRVARFAARFGFEVAPETLVLMREMTASGELATLPAERVWQELQRALAEPHPERFVGVLRECGALAALLPEVDGLFGVPQPAQHHPEVDTGAHLMLALALAARLGASAPVRFAVLLHDLGKGLTAPESWPRHIAHETRGVPLVKAVCARLRAPRGYSDLAVLVAKFHTDIHRTLELRPGTVVDLLTDLDALRRPARFEEILFACEIDARGRGGREETAYPQAALLRRAREAVQAVDVRAIVATSGEGEALKRALRAARVVAVSAARAAGQLHV